MRILLLLTLAAAAGCSPRPTGWRAVGTEPGWALAVAPEGSVDLQWAYGEQQARWAGHAATAEGDATRLVARGDPPMTATLRPGPCSDGMSDRTYAFAATVVVAGDTLVGCADRLSADESR